MQMNNAQNLEARDMDDGAEDSNAQFYPTKTDEYKAFRERKTHIVVMAIINPNEKGAMRTIGTTAIHSTW